ncbi:Conserved_hypothetical protein [Hexamita inflata]|uniref:Uncharacterized protein n=1 Tax=Hexamita inflata TaxID=28002 RepID=A0AA86V2K9_9EUKA|nr:Conserved hypothetical protein [Hexamita inflata]
MIIQINCTNSYGYAIVNGSCIQSSCSILGQQRINGICQCTIINSIVKDGSCICPVNSQEIGSVCVCTIIGSSIQNGVCTCSTFGAFVNNSSCTCGVGALNISNTCTCPVNSSMVNYTCFCNAIYGQQIINGTCQCPFGYSIVDNSCQQTSYQIDLVNLALQCSQQLFTQKFNILSVTNSIAQSNFSVGFVFESTNVINNAFVDIQDNVYTTNILPLFQSQNAFMNVKIQYGTQLSLNTGSFILTQSTYLTINQMNIISKFGKQITVNTAQQLNILTSSSTYANIKNLLVNLSITSSNGNITLVDCINDIFNITGYQVLGIYNTTQTTALISIQINTVAVNVNQINFKPSIYNVGNGSSYLFSQVVNSASTLKICNLIVVIGNNSLFQILGSISTTEFYSIYYQFGGIIAYIANNSQIVTIDNIIFDSYQNFSTSYVTYSGFLVGNIKSITSSITILNVCFQQNITSNTLKFGYFGLIGRNQANISIQNASISFYCQGAYFWNHGIIGLQDSSLYAEVLNLKVSVRVISAVSAGSIIGFDKANNCIILNTYVTKVDNSGSSQVGGFIGFQYSTVSIKDSTLTNSNISSTKYVGGFVSYCQSNLHLNNSSIQFVRFSGSSFGIIVGYNNGGTYSFINSVAFNNYINNNLQNDCLVLSNTWSITGC